MFVVALQDGVVPGDANSIHEGSPKFWPFRDVFFRAPGKAPVLGFLDSSHGIFVLWSGGSSPGGGNYGLHSCRAARLGYFRAAMSESPKLVPPADRPGDH